MAQRIFVRPIRFKSAILTRSSPFKTHVCSPRLCPAARHYSQEAACLVSEDAERDVAFTPTPRAKCWSAPRENQLQPCRNEILDAAEGDSVLSGVFEQAVEAMSPRTSWTKKEISNVYNKPLIELTYGAAQVHRRFHDPAAIQMCTLMNIKTGGCTEDCSYCAQSSRYNTGLKASKMVDVESVLEAARVAKENGSSRFCMGAAWRDMRGRKTNLKNVKEMVKGVRALGMEACVTLGMIDAEQAKELKDAGLTAYNHNVDTSREHYPSVITTRSYDERLATIDNVQKAGIHVCTGGILGLGEKPEDHVGLIHTVATLPAHPESFPVNALVPIKGTPLGESKRISFDAILRTIATARLVLPTTIIRLAAGRHTMSEERQMMCFMAGANAIFTGEKMLTTACNGWEEDKAMFERWGLRPMKSHETVGGKQELAQTKST